MTVKEYIDFIAKRITNTIVEAWNQREVGGISYGQGTAVVGRNRRWVDHGGKAIMYTPDAQEMQRIAATEDVNTSPYSLTSKHGLSFSHIEGYEDHTVQVLATYTTEKSLTGMIVNVPCPSQESEEEFLISADWWHETRNLLRERYGEHIFILPQCSAAGDLSLHLLYDARAHNRMLALKKRTTREEIAMRITHAIDEIIPFIGNDIEWKPHLEHIYSPIDLTMGQITAEEADEAAAEALKWTAEFEKLMNSLNDESGVTIREQKRWYVHISYIYALIERNLDVVNRFKNKEHKFTANTHFVRLGDVAFASHPFEVYLDFGIQIKLRSPAIQTFLVQLAGEGTYLPSERSVAGGGYGSTAASNPVGPDGGKELVEHTVRMIQAMW